MNNPSEEEILKAIDNSGYLFEQEIGSILEGSGFHIKTNAAFKDADEETSREIDVLAFKRAYWNEEKKISIGIKVLCECKNNNNPFVFIERNKSSSDKFYCPPNFQFPIEKFNQQIEGKPNSYKIVPAFRHFEIDKFFPYSLSNNKAVQFCKIVRRGKNWNAFHDGIYDSILFPIIKCLEYFKAENKKMINSEWSNSIVYFPLVVLNSKIYSIDSNIKPTKLNETELVSFTRDIDAKKYKDRYLIDFVNKDGLQNYLDNHLNPFVEKFVKKLTE